MPESEVQLLPLENRMKKKAVCKTCHQMVRLTADGVFEKHRVSKENRASDFCSNSGEPAWAGERGSVSVDAVPGNGVPVNANLLFSCNCPKDWDPSSGMQAEPFKRPFNLAMNGFIGMFGMPEDIDVEIVPSQNRMFITLRVVVDRPKDAERMKNHFDWLLKEAGLRYDGQWE